MAQEDNGPQYVDRARVRADGHEAKITRVLSGCARDLAKKQDKEANMGNAGGPPIPRGNICVTGGPNRGQPSTERWG